jgi:hypothetical protein
MGQFSAENSRSPGQIQAEINSDIANGLLEVEKRGRSTRIAGPKAKRYLAGHSNVAA